MNFSTITPEMIIGNGVRDRDWTQRDETEKRCSWHFHISADDVHACVTGVRGDTEAAAANDAIDEFFEAQPEISPNELFGNRNWTYCAGTSCSCPFVPGCRVIPNGKAEITALMDASRRDNPATVKP